MSDFDRFRHDNSAYERPNLRYRCGRACSWEKPCPRGPLPDGSCGGTSECQPFLRDGRYHCTRPASAGGPCEEGPLPNGSCQFERPACAPALSVRVLRRRLGALVASVLVCFVVLGASVGGFFAFGLIGIDAGPLTKQHANAVPHQRCETCHAPHRQGFTSWLKVAFSGGRDGTDDCLACHAFGGPERTPHNFFRDPKAAIDQAAFARLGDVGRQCVRCHSEHKGADADIARLSDAQCGTCHEQKFDRFSKDHPRFAEGFPHFERTSIRFNHVIHLQQYFQSPRHKDRAPKSCLTCHNVEEAATRVPLRGYDVACAACHDAEIVENELAFLVLPELPERPDYDSVRELCRSAIGGESEVRGPDDYFPISVEPLNPLAAYLLEVDGEDPDSYGDAVADLLAEMAQEGGAALFDLVDERAEPLNARDLLSGLNSETARRLGCDWLENREYDPPVGATTFGWYGREMALMYRPTGHLDLVVRRWLELSLAAGSDDESEEAELATVLRDSLIDDRFGAGSCTKCHAVGQEAASDDTDSTADKLEIAWRQSPKDIRPHTLFAHRPHLDFFATMARQEEDRQLACGKCHQLDQAADYNAGFEDFDRTGFASNFKPILIENCRECHARTASGGEDCQLCHRYHRAPSLQSQRVAEQ